MISEKTYYEYMNHFGDLHKFDIVHDRWYKCFDRILRMMKVGYKKPQVDSLFYKFYMENWDALQQENTVYRDTKPIELAIEFSYECIYISDRPSYDRLFRTHWLFRKAFGKEFYLICTNKEI
jgi:hypothetical protein